MSNAVRPLASTALSSSRHETRISARGTDREATAFIRGVVVPPGSISSPDRRSRDIRKRSMLSSPVSTAKKTAGQGETELNKSVRSLSRFSDNFR